MASDRPSVFQETETCGHSKENFIKSSSDSISSSRTLATRRLSTEGCSEDTPVQTSLFTDFNTTSFTSSADTDTSARMLEKCNTADIDHELAVPSRPWKNRGRKRLYKLTYILVAYTIGIVLINCYRASGYGNGRDSGSSIKARANGDSGDYQMLERFRRDAETGNSLGEEKNCTERSVDNFPPNFLSFEDTRDGGVFLHILIALYLFAALAVVCDDYFVPSLEHICEDLGLQADVAGATFMAAGSSAPEFMTSVVGVFFAKSDVGVGTIVGSAVFNILFIIGVCGIFAGMIVELTWYPLVRDTLYYLLSVLTLFLIIMDQDVFWYEALIMIILYGFYILIMYFNRYLETSAKAWVSRMMAKLERQPLVAKPPEEHIIPEDMRRARAHRHLKQSVESIPMTRRGYAHFDDNTSRISQSSMSISQSYEKHPHIDQTVPEEQETTLENNSPDTPSTSSTKNGQLLTLSEYESVWTVPEGFLMRCIWVGLCPIRVFLYFTIPDSRRPGLWARLYLLSFVMSVAWISGLTYIMVWMVTIAGDAFDIPDTVMGLTLLAAGTSVPDCLASIFVARDGYGDMAVSNSLGSNVFDILICLGIPWLIEIAINMGDPVEITSGGLTFSALTLLATVAFLLISIGINKWRLTKTYGGLCLGAYLIVITLSCLFELNVFDDINPPSCPR